MRGVVGSLPLSPLPLLVPFLLKGVLQPWSSLYREQPLNGVCLVLAGTLCACAENHVISCRVQ